MSKAPGPGFRPTHVVPPHGLPAWEAPDPARPTVPLDGLLPVQLVERSGDWGHIRCANGWAAWVDGRLLLAVPADPPLAAGPDTAADPRPLLDRAAETLAGYRSAVAGLAAGELDGEDFRDRTEGLRIGIVVDGESMWVYDAPERRWMYGDGRRLSTYATDRAIAPAAPADAPGHAPTRAVAPEGGR
ncbi:hypothetical protein NX794_35075 [Streptomyces sp. LP11]|uniref:Integral membrane protein n=1 Tax=Streptomyces pyxinicus TaxID=2970331 RepID=A0ABT2BCZ8_9ACTN|nr:hypothetical protein [Streptomyces sp. LP11]MCS0606394.1 hypothetical protein [Streptomyces sp. LP11]